jgi:hypothetical protein
MTLLSTAPLPRVIIKNEMLGFISFKSSWNFKEAQMKIRWSSARNHPFGQ